MSFFYKFKKKDPEKKYHSNIAITAYEPVHISSYNIDDLVKAAPLGISGTYRLIQRVINVVFMVSKKQDDICWEIASALGFRKLKTASKNIDDVYFVCTNVNAMYLYAYHYYVTQIPNKAAATFSSWIESMDDSIFTYEQYIAMGWVGEYGHGGDLFTQLITRGEELIAYIDDDVMDDNELIMINIDQDANIGYKTNLMAAAEYSVCSTNHVIVFINPYKYGLIREMHHDIQNYNDSAQSSLDDDMIACEILNDEYNLKDNQQ
jgi:hypothetical protein